MRILGKEREDKGYSFEEGSDRTTRNGNHVILVLNGLEFKSRAWGR